MLNRSIINIVIVVVSYSIFFIVIVIETVIDIVQWRFVGRSIVDRLFRLPAYIYSNLANVYRLYFKLLLCNPLPSFQGSICWPHRQSFIVIWWWSLDLQQIVRFVPFRYFVVLQLIFWHLTINDDDKTIANIIIIIIIITRL